MKSELEKIIIPYLEELGLEKYTDLVLNSDFTALEDGHLTKLDLGLTKRATLPEDAFTRFPHIEMLNLTAMDLEELPENIFNPLPELRVLGLGRNKLTDLNKDYFKNNKKLELIDVKQTPLKIPLNLPGVKILTEI